MLKIIKYNIHQYLNTPKKQLGEYLKHKYSDFQNRFQPRFRIPTILIKKNFKGSI